MSDDELQDVPVDFDDVPDDGNFEDFEGGGATLGEMWRNNPLVKIGVIAGGLVTIIGAVILFGGEKSGPLRSRVGGGADVAEAPGTSQVSDSYKKAVEESNVQRTEDAIRAGESAMPTPVDTPFNKLELPTEPDATEDPLARWRRIQEERERQATQRPKLEAPANPYAEATDQLATAMAAQMESILGAKTPIKPSYILVTDPVAFNEMREEEAQQSNNADQTVQTDLTAQSEGVVHILIPAGNIEYGQLVTEANSDNQGPVLAQLASGPLAGSKLLGTFKVEEDNLVLDFNTIIIDGISHSTRAVAMNPETTGIGLATDIDRRYFSRVILPAASAFVTGLGEGVVSVNQTTVNAGSGTTVSSSQELDTTEQLFSGIKEASSKIGEILDENSDKTNPLIRVRAGTPIGLLFVEPVTDETQ